MRAVGQITITDRRASTNQTTEQNAEKAGGRIHVIDGFLDWPTLTAANSGFAQTKPLDIMDTLKQCDKFDGFVTLAEGTGLTQILKQGKSS